jgi:hypothetical protein
VEPPEDIRKHTKEWVSTSDGWHKLQRRAKKGPQWAVILVLNTRRPQINEKNNQTMTNCTSGWPIYVTLANDTKMRNAPANGHIKRWQKANT